MWRPIRNSAGECTCGEAVFGLYKFMVKFEAGEWVTRCPQLNTGWISLKLPEKTPFELICFHASKRLFQEYKQENDKFVTSYINYQRGFQKEVEALRK